MPRSAFALILTAAVLAAPAVALEPPLERDFTVVNDTAQEVEFLYLITPTGGWPEDLLGQDVLAAGAELDLTLEGDACRYDLKAVFKGGAEIVRYDFDVCARPEIRLGAELAAEMAAGAGAGSPPPPAPTPVGEPQSLDEPAPPRAQAPGRGLPICPGDPRCKKK